MYMTSSHIYDDGNLFDDINIIFKISVSNELNNKCYCNSSGTSITYVYINIKLQS